MLGAEFPHVALGKGGWHYAKCGFPWLLSELCPSQVNGPMTLPQARRPSTVSSDSSFRVTGKISRVKAVGVLSTQRAGELMQTKVGFLRHTPGGKHY